MVGKAQTSNQIKLPYDGPRLKPGRHFCHCQARIHGLVRNCLSCGRVTCTQEGSGPCFNCGNLVCTREERQILDENSKRSYELLQRLMSDNSSINPQKKDTTKSFSHLGSSFLQANEYKQKLLAADNNK
uniref:Zinc finger C2HC5-type domain-containing protein n=1 Tax=Ditylenchus dipsaci TaxID=166011 RepID=A0A915D280_9BILA